MRSLSLFSGIGGLDLAAEWAGIEPVVFCQAYTLFRAIVEMDEAVKESTP